jgi:hypothetical protein
MLNFLSKKSQIRENYSPKCISNDVIINLNLGLLNFGILFGRKEKSFGMEAEIG